MALQGLQHNTNENEKRQKQESEALASEFRNKTRRIN
jgi:hypothetical protein